MTKVIVTLAVLLLAVLLALGGVYVYKTMSSPAAEETSAGDSAEDPSKSGKGPLGRMKTAETDSDIPGLMTYAMEKSQDAVGWLNVPGTDISNVVMQGPDNVYYERRDEDGNQDIYGCYFLDMECSLGKREDFLPNTIIYGHSDLTDNPDGPRFSQLFRFVDDEFASQNKYMYITTLEGRYTFEIFTVFYTDISFDYIRVHMTNEEALALAKQAKSLSVRDYGIEPVAGDRLLTLSTCSVRDGNDGTHRFVVMGRLTDAEVLDMPKITEPVDDVPAAEQEEASSSANASEDSSTDASSQQQPEPQGALTQPQVPQPIVPQPGDLQQPNIPDMVPTQPDFSGQPQFQQPAG